MRCLKIKTQDDNCEQAMKNFSLHHSKPIYFDFNLKRKLRGEIDKIDRISVKAEKKVSLPKTRLLPIFIGWNNKDSRFLCIIPQRLK